MRQHYTLSKYYPFWAVIADRAVRYGANSILDIGCGAGQFASLLYDKGLREYCGIDFSRKRIEHARLVCPDFTFVVKDALETKVYGTLLYDTVICT
ncbi:MAG: methyltransferase domain-containing protein, partial [Woeseiaceae bacterium]|nr:methyltransferase domain-containing protein [Woeseiaceae bacterium]